MIPYRRPMSPASPTAQEICTFCPKMCRHACPVAAASGVETWIPQAKMAVLAQLRRGHEPWSIHSTEPLWACTDCRHCTSYCVHGIQPGLALTEGRAEAVRRGAEHPALARYPDRFRARGARLQLQLREQVAPDRVAEEAEVALWPGCDAIDKGARDVAALLRLLDRLGADHVRVAATRETCGGYPLLAAGHRDAFRWHAARVATELSRYRTVLMSCAACVYVLRQVYPQEGIQLSTQVLHTTEYLEPLAVRISGGARPASVWYHDPCFLSRHLGVVAAPRKLLARVAEVREFAWSGTDSECCGGGGLLAETMPSVANEMARRRLGEVADAGGGTVVTSCATCKHRLAENAPPGVTVRDLADLVEERWRAKS